MSKGCTYKSLLKKLFCLAVVAVGIGALSTFAITSVDAPKANADVGDVIDGVGAGLDCLNAGTQYCKDNCGNSKQCHHKVNDCCQHPGGEGCPNAVNNQQNNAA